MNGLRFVLQGFPVCLALDYDSGYDDDYYYDDVELIYDLDDATPSDATPSDTVQAVTLSTIHGDIQLLNVTVLLVYVILFVLFIVKKGR